MTVSSPLRPASTVGTTAGSPAWPPATMAPSCPLTARPSAASGAVPSWDDLLGRR